MAEQPQSSLPTFGLNHAKNYFGVPSAIAAEGDTGGLIMGHLVQRQFGTVKRGAIELGLITPELTLTPLGSDVAGFAEHQYGSQIEALEQFREWKGTHTRFVNLDDGVWRGVAAQVMHEYTPAQQVTTVLAELEGSVTLPEFIAAAGRAEPPVARLFLNEDVIPTLPPLDALDASDERLDKRTAYRSTAVCQLKSVLYHCGILTELGTDSGTLVPAADIWDLDTGTGCVPIALEGVGETDLSEGMV